MKRSRALVVIAAVTAVVGVGTAFALAAVLPSHQRTFAVVAVPVQLLISVGVPFLGAVATSSLRGGASTEVRHTLAGAAAWALGFAVLGLVATAAAVAILASSTTEAPWAKALPIVLGSLLVQVVAMFIGTGFGLLLRRPVLASLATVVLPLAVWFLLVEVAPGARLWLTPLEGANRLLAGTMAASDWLPYVVMLSIWVVALNLAGLRRLDQPVEPRAASLDPSARA